jgi:uncharacterized protein YndB with AHSA1/START domain
MKIRVGTVVNAEPSRVRDAWNDPADIEEWNSAQDDWRTTRSTVDLREGGKFTSRMEAKDGSAGFDFEGTYTRVVPGNAIEYLHRAGWQAILNSFRRHVEAKV